jgi:hypothetical protein
MFSVKKGFLFYCCTNLLHDKETPAARVGKAEKK